jgi:hypothetical protein
MRTGKKVDRWINKTPAIFGLILTAGIVAMALVGSSSMWPDETATNSRSSSMRSEGFVPL